jgi:nucleotide-binding universal stress UspA family protein
VVGVDGSEESKVALRWAVDYAKTVGARVRAVIAWRWPMSIVVTLPATEMFDPMDEALKTLNAAVADALGDGAESAGVRVDVAAAYGAPVPVLLDEATRASLLVVGSRGHGGFHGLLLGSTGEHCVRHAVCPVVVVRPQDDKPRADKPGDDKRGAVRHTAAAGV